MTWKHDCAMARLVGTFALAGLLMGQGPPAVSPIDLYRQGHYEEAIAAGKETGDGAGFAVAARAALAIATLGDGDPCLECLQRAERLARASIAADPVRPEGHVYLAVSRGSEARIIGMVRAGAAGYADEAKKALQAALAAEPNDPWALAAFGGWNIEIVRNGGAFMAGLVYSASEDDGRAFFARAFAADPGNLVLRFQYALSLSGYDLNGARAEIQDALVRAAAGTPRTAYDRVTKGRAQKLLDLLQAGDDDAYAALVRRYQGFPPAS